MIDALLALPNFIWLAVISGLLIAWLAAPLGVFVVWQRQAYFGETLAHSALLGIGLGLLLDFNLTLAMIITSFLIVFALHHLRQSAHLATDTLLGILAHGSLALGLVVISLQGNIQLDIMGQRTKTRHWFNAIAGIGFGGIFYYQLECVIKYNVKR